LKAISKVIDCEQTIFKKMEEILEIKLVLLVSAAVAGTLIFIGTLAFSKPILAIGAIIGFGTVLVLIFNTSYKHGEESISVHAKTMLAALECLKSGNKIIYSEPAGDTCEHKQFQINVLKSSTGCNESHHGNHTDASDTSKSRMTSVLPASTKDVQIYETKNAKEPLETLTTKVVSPVSHYPSPISDDTANYSIPNY
jgi:hypothetical protein